MCLCKCGGCGLKPGDNSFQHSLGRGMCVARWSFMSVVKTGYNLPGDSPALLSHNVVYATRKGAFLCKEQVYSFECVSLFLCCKHFGIKWISQTQLCRWWASWTFNSSKQLPWDHNIRPVSYRWWIPFPFLVISFLLSLHDVTSASLPH